MLSFGVWVGEEGEGVRSGEGGGGVSAAGISFSR